jgi:hypothetical protein
MSATLVTPKTTSGGEIIRELVNASDGQGLHLDGSAGGINLGSSMPDLGTKYSLEFVVKGDSKTGVTYLLDAYNSSSTNRVILAWSGSSTGNIQLRINGTWSNAFIATPDNGEVVHLLLSVDGTSATLYQNGNSVSTQTVVANTLTGATNTHIGTTQNGTGSFFNGTIYRARFYNRTLSADDVRTAYERADVPVADQYGEQNLVDAAASAFTSGTYSWVAYTGNSIANVSNDLTITYGGNSNGAYNYLEDSKDLNQDLVVGKKYRLRMRAKYAGGASGVAVQVYDGSASTVADSALTTSFADYEIEFTAQSITDRPYVYLNDLKSSNVVTIDTWQVDEIGCVSDYDLAFANPTQSLTVQDRSGAADGTASASGVTQVQPIIQGNLTSLAVGSAGLPAGVPADNHVFIGDTTTTPLAGADDLIIARGSNDAGVTIRTATTATGQICFADGNTGNEQYRGFIGYAHGTDKLNLGSGGATAMSIDSSGNVNVNGGGYVKIGRWIR